MTERPNPRREEQRMNDLNDISPATPETDEERLGRIAEEILDAHLGDEDQYLRERREEEEMSA